MHEKHPQGRPAKDILDAGFEACINSSGYSRCKRYFPKGQGLPGLVGFLYCCEECRQAGTERAKKKYTTYLKDGKVIRIISGEEFEVD